MCRGATRSPSKYFSFVVHLDGLKETHDIAVERKGVYDVAMNAIEAFRDAGCGVTPFAARPVKLL